MKARWNLYYIYAQVSFGSKVVPSQNQECQLATDFKYNFLSELFWLFKAEKHQFLEEFSKSDVIDRLQSCNENISEYNVLFGAVLKHP